jgi:N-acetyl-anhydromuramyl-L-alanine amidase AmpD
MNPIPPLVLYCPPVRVVRPPLPTKCWDGEEHIVNGFSTAAEWMHEFNEKRHIRAIVWHSMEGGFRASVDWWNKGNGGAHLCVLRTGQVVLTCPLEHVAWHAGTNNTPTGGQFGRTPFWRSHNINAYSVGVELEGKAADGFTPAQAIACRRVSDWLTASFPIPRVHTFDEIDGHHAHAELSASRGDPGSHFKWEWVL